MKAVAAAAVLGLVPACMHAAHEPSVPVMLFPSYTGPEEFEFCADLLGRFISRAGFVAQTAILFSCGEKVDWIKPVSHLFQQLDVAEIDDFLRFLPAMFSIVGAICGLPQAFRHQYVSTGAAESGEMRGRREVHHR